MIHMSSTDSVEVGRSGQSQTKDGNAEWWMKQHFTTQAYSFTDREADRRADGVHKGVPLTHSVRVGPVRTCTDMYRERLRVRACVCLYVCLRVSGQSPGSESWPNLACV